MENGQDHVEFYTLHGIQAVQCLMKDLAAALLDYCDDLVAWGSSDDRKASSAETPTSPLAHMHVNRSMFEWWSPTVTQMEFSAEGATTGGRLLYMYMDQWIAEQCVKGHCLVYNSTNFGALLTSLPPYLPEVRGQAVCDRLRSLGGGTPMIDYREPCWSTHFVSVLQEDDFEKIGSLSIDTDSGNRLAFEVFTMDSDCLQYDVVSAGRTLFQLPM